MLAMHYTYMGTLKEFHGKIYREVPGRAYPVRNPDGIGTTMRGQFFHVSGDPNLTLTGASFDSMAPIGLLPVK